MHRIPAGAFRPVPAVDGGVLRVQPRRPPRLSHGRRRALVLARSSGVDPGAGPARVARRRGRR